MSLAYYNEHDEYAAEWLRNLIAAGHIAPGMVDSRDIRDIVPDELKGFTQCHFFAGLGGWSYALRQAGISDNQTLWTGSCPCQPFSAAGKGEGFADERHLWPYWHWLVEQCGPDLILGEQVSSKDTLPWIDLVFADLEGSNYACGFIDTSAASFGAPFYGQRLYWLAEAPRPGRRRRVEMETWISEKFRGPSAPVRSFPRIDGRGSKSTLSVADVCSPSYGVPGRVGLLRGYGNALDVGQATAFCEVVKEICDA